MSINEIMNKKIDKNEKILLLMNELDKSLKLGFKMSEHTAMVADFVIQDIKKIKDSIHTLDPKFDINQTTIHQRAN